MYSTVYNKVILILGLIGIVGGAVYLITLLNSSSDGDMSIHYIIAVFCILMGSTFAIIGLAFSIIANARKKNLKILHPSHIKHTADTADIHFFEDILIKTPEKKQEMREDLLQILLERLQL